jgi:hypothetical protein
VGCKSDKFSGTLLEVLYFFVSLMIEDKTTGLMIGLTCLLIGLDPQLRRAMEILILGGLTLFNDWVNQWVLIDIESESLG